jgi:hypothetical protein
VLTFKLKGGTIMNIKKLRNEILSFFEEVAELREKARKITRGSDE